MQSLNLLKYKLHTALYNMLVHLNEAFIIDVMIISQYITTELALPYLKRWSQNLMF